MAMTAPTGLPPTIPTTAPTTAPTALAPVPQLLSTDLLYAFTKVGQRASTALDTALAGFDLKARHYAVLAALHEAPASSQQEVGNRLGIDRTTMAVTVDDLETRNLVTRTQQPGNRRAHRVALTASGRRLAAKVRKAVDEAEAELVDTLTPSQAATLGRLLRRLTAGAS